LTAKRKEILECTPEGKIQILGLTIDKAKDGKFPIENAGYKPVGCACVRAITSQPNEL